MSPIVRRPVSARHSLAVPVPRDLEPRSEWEARFNSSDVVRSKYPTPIKRKLAAEQAWRAAKKNSLVSIVTSEDQFLLLGSL